MQTAEGQQLTFRTRSDAAVGYDVENWFSRGARADRRNVFLTLVAGLITDIYARQPTTGKKLYP